MKTGTKVSVTIRDWDGRTGTVVAIVRETQFDGFKRRILTEYIVQFERPLEWSYFSRKELKVVR